MCLTILEKSLTCLILRFADDVIEASDGTVYFTDVSSKFGFDDWLLDYLEARPNGRLLKYEPSTKTTSEVLSYLSFPNGVALSEGEDYLVVCETLRQDTLLIFVCIILLTLGPHISYCHVTYTKPIAMI